MALRYNQASFDIHMTKVQKTFHFQHALDESTLSRLADANAIYGIERITVDPSRVDLTVEYDASRLREAEIESALQRAGVPIVAIP